MDVMDNSWLPELIIKNSYLDNYFKKNLLKRFFVKKILKIFSLVKTAFSSSMFLLIFPLVRTAFLSSILNLKSVKKKHLKKELNEELMPVAWHPNRWWEWCISDDEKKEIDRMFIEEL